MDDAELMRRWQIGDTSAFEVLVRRWQIPVSRFLARMLGCEATIDDLTQEVFLRVYQKRAGYREEGQFSTWLYQIALNLVRDQARRQKRSPMPLPDEVPANHLTIEDYWMQQEAHQILDSALQELSTPLREVLVLRHYEGMRFEEMSRVYGIPASTLKSRFSTAIKQMQTILKSYGWRDEEASI
jgi:RNA polymerase sigma-70 factor (ECF subfamily)